MAEEKKTRKIVLNERYNMFVRRYDILSSHICTDLGGTYCNERYTGMYNLMKQITGRDPYGPLDIIEDRCREFRCRGGRRLFAAPVCMMYEWIKYPMSEEDLKSLIYASWIKFKDILEERFGAKFLEFWESWSDQGTYMAIFEIQDYAEYAKNPCKWWE